MSSGTRARVCVCACVYARRPARAGAKRVDARGSLLILDVLSALRYTDVLEDVTLANVLAYRAAQ